MEFRVDLAPLTTRLNAAGPRAASKALALTRHHTALLEARTKANAALPASGPPGPRLITGNYNRSWTSETHMTGLGAQGTAGTNAPQGPRLEFGFVGVDRAGRHFNQPPYVHLGTAFEATKPGWEAAMRTVAVF